MRQWIAGYLSGGRLCALLLGALLSSLAPMTSAQGEPELPVDPAGNRPADVVRVQLEALQGNDQDNTGIALAWEFNSPANRAANGSLARFVQVIHRGFPDLLGSRSFEIGEPSLKDQLASVPVLLVCKHGRQHGFVFWLSQQHPAELAGHWLTEGVTPIEVPAVAPPRATDPPRPQKNFI